MADVTQTLIPPQKKKKKKKFLPQEIEIKGHDVMCTYRWNLVFQDIFRELIVKLCIQAKNWPSQTLFRIKNFRVAWKAHFWNMRQSN